MGLFGEAFGKARRVSGGYGKEDCLCKPAETATEEMRAGDRGRSGNREKCVQKHTDKGNKGESARRSAETGADMGFEKEKLKQVR